MRRAVHAASYLRVRPFFVVALAVLCIPASTDVLLSQEDNRVVTANYQLAARFTGAKMEKMVFDTSVNPHWLENSDRFWYSWETPDGKDFYLVDPTRQTKTPIFDPVKMASDLTRLTKDPYDALHLPIETVKFVKDNTAIQFDVESSQDEEREDTEEGEEQEREEQEE